MCPSVMGDSNSSLIYLFSYCVMCLPHASLIKILVGASRRWQDDQEAAHSAVAYRGMAGGWHGEAMLT